MAIEADRARAMREMAGGGGSAGPAVAMTYGIGEENELESSLFLPKEGEHLLLLKKVGMRRSTVAVVREMG